jgi:hypothetical protein
MVAIPIAAFLTIRSLMPAEGFPSHGYAVLIFTLTSLAGVPIVFYTALAGWTLICRRWSRLAILAGLSLVASVAAGAYLLWSDMRAMPAIERYSGSGWYLVIIWGAYVVGLLALFGLAARGVIRYLASTARKFRQTGRPPALTG